MVCLQVTVGSTVSGVDRLSSWTLRCHHLREEGRAGRAESRQVGVKGNITQGDRGADQPGVGQSTGTQVLGVALLRDVLTRASSW